MLHFKLPWTNVTKSYYTHLNHDSRCCMAWYADCYGCYAEMLPWLQISCSPYYSVCQCPSGSYLAWYLCGWSSCCGHTQYGQSSTKQQTELGPVLGVITDKWILCTWATITAISDDLSFSLISWSGALGMEPIQSSCTLTTAKCTHPPHPTQKFFKQCMDIIIWYSLLPRGIYFF